MCRALGEKSPGSGRHWNPTWRPPETSPLPRGYRKHLGIAGPPDQLYAHLSSCTEGAVLSKTFSWQVSWREKKTAIAELCKCPNLEVTHSIFLRKFYQLKIKQQTLNIRVLRDLKKGSIQGGYPLIIKKWKGETGWSSRPTEPLWPKCWDFATERVFPFRVWKTFGKS